MPAPPTGAASVSSDKRPCSPVPGEGASSPRPHRDGRVRGQTSVRRPPAPTPAGRVLVVLPHPPPGVTVRKVPAGVVASELGWELDWRDAGPCQGSGRPLPLPGALGEGPQTAAGGEAAVSALRWGASGSAVPDVAARTLLLVHAFLVLFFEVSSIICLEKKTFHVSGEKMSVLGVEHGVHVLTGPHPACSGHLRLSVRG